MLLVFSAPASQFVFRKQMNQIGQIRSLAMSLNGNYVAVGSDGEISIWNIKDDTNPARKIMLSDSKVVNSQRINFSRDGSKVVIATRQPKGQIEIILFDHLDSREIWRRTNPKREEFTNNDHGLSAVFYGRKKQVVLTSYANKPYSLVHSNEDQSVTWPERNGKLQAAVQRASESQFILLSDTGSLYTLDLDGSMVQPKPLKPAWDFRRKSKPGSPDQFVAMAEPEPNYIFAFWVEKEEMILEVIKDGEEPVGIPFQGPQYD